MDTDQLKKLWNEKPLEVLAAASAVGIAASKIIDSVASARSRSAYARQINRKSSRRK